MKVHTIHGGSLYHYAHFLCDCLYPEVIYELYRQPCVYRVKSLGQTLGAFSTIYEEVMQNKSVEVAKDVFDQMPDPPVIVRNLRRRNQRNRELHHMPVFRNYVFQRYNINPDVYDPHYPSIVLIKRGSAVLLTDKDFCNLKTRNGNRRREIADVSQIEAALPPSAKSYFLEEQPFIEQIKIFNNAKVIILAHGAAMSNMFFCKKGATIVEVVCGKKWAFFDTLSRVLQLNHLKVEENTPEAVIRTIQTVLPADSCSDCTAASTG